MADTTASEKSSLLNNKKVSETLIEVKKIPFSQKILSFIGINIGLSVFFAGMFSIVFFIYGSLLTRTIILILLVIQFCFAKKSKTYLDFLKFLKPWEYFRSYKLHTEEDLANSNSMFCFHPHGLMNFGVAMCGGTNETLAESVFCGSRAMINTPVSGLFARLMGLQGVNPKNFKELLGKGKNIIFIPGGFEEATLTDYRRDRAYINERKGFIKYALEFGYKIHPCYTFGENKIYYTVNILEKFRLFINKFKIPAVMFYGKFLIFPVWDIDLFTVIGKAIQFPKIDNPTKEDVEKYHKIYVDSLIEVYNRYKHKYNASEELEIN